MILACFQKVPLHNDVGKLYFIIITAVSIVHFLNNSRDKRTCTYSDIEQV